jgi:acyl-CoA dehydrogenase
MRAFQHVAREAGLWTQPLPAHLSGHSLDLSTLAEIEERSDLGPTALGSDLLLDVIMLDRHATATVRDRAEPVTAPDLTQADDA